MLMIFLLIHFDEGLSNLRSSKIYNKQSDDSPRSPSMIHREIDKVNIRKCKGEVKYESGASLSFNRY